jgi:hypothetical protein
MPAPRTPSARKRDIKNAIAAARELGLEHYAVVIDGGKVRLEVGGVPAPAKPVDRMDAWEAKHGALTAPKSSA